MKSENGFYIIFVKNVSSANFEGTVYSFLCRLKQQKCIKSRFKSFCLVLVENMGKAKKSRHMSIMTTGMHTSIVF